MTSEPAHTPESISPETTSAPPARPWYVSAILAVAAVTLLLLGAWGAARLRSPYPFFGTAYPQGTAATGFTGTVSDTPTAPPHAFTFTPGQGQVTAVFFGFTHCASICPLTLSYLNKVRDALPDDQKARFRILLVSVDPARDTPGRLNEYASYFGKEGVGVHSPEPQLATVAQAYGVGYQKADVRGADYQINHTTATYLIDAQGNLRVLWDYTQLPQVARVQADLQHVMETR
jgi:protein SCO1/2